ncbi:MAG: DMT family transporter [Scytonema sp. PMC 1069.18]|nr:DMT family transporter [Scytonema sp. PMC 1069.18]MEC4882306.1 DMT family transporter [Scytonema sp. PMC 1070.18]
MQVNFSEEQKKSELQHWHSIIAFFLVAILFGSIPPVTKFAIASMSPAVLLSTRYTIAVFLFIPLIVKSVLNYNPIHLCRSQLPALPMISTEIIVPETNSVVSQALLKDSVVLGILTFGIHLCLSFGVQTISANRASFLFGLCIILTSLLDFIYHKRFSLRIFSAAVISFGGSGLMSWEQSHEPIIGTLWLLGAIACEATLLILLEDMAPRHDPLILSILRLSVAALFSLLLAIPELSNQLTIIQDNWMPLLYLGAVTAATSWLVIFALQTLLAAEAALIQALEPVFGAMISFILLGEVFSWRGLVGSGLILTGIVLAILTTSNGLAHFFTCWSVKNG